MNPNPAGLSRPVCRRAVAVTMTVAEIPGFADGVVGPTLTVSEILRLDAPSFGGLAATRHHGLRRRAAGYSTRNGSGVYPSAEVSRYRGAGQAGGISLPPSLCCPSGLRRPGMRRSSRLVDDRLAKPRPDPP